MRHLKYIYFFKIAVYHKYLFHTISYSAAPMYQAAAVFCIIFLARLVVHDNTRNKLQMFVARLDHHILNHHVQMVLFWLHQRLAGVNVISETRKAVIMFLLLWFNEVSIFFMFGHFKCLYGDAVIMDVKTVISLLWLAAVWIKTIITWRKKANDPIMSFAYYINYNHKLIVQFKFLPESGTIFTKSRNLSRFRKLYGAKRT